MSLQEKILRLELEGATAMKHAQWWRKQIKTYGVSKVTEFYTSLGLNHLQTKGYEWEGLTLSREPKEHEKIAVKGIANAQESAKEQIGAVLLSLRTDLIAQGMEAIERLSPKDYHTLVLEVPKGTKAALRDRMDDVYRRGRILVAQELRLPPKGKHIPSDGEVEFRELGITLKQDDDEIDSDEELNELADVTDARVVNDVQSRITGAATRFVLLGLAGAALLSAIQTEIEAGSVSYIDRASTGLANKVVSIGRMDEMRARASEIERYEYSALLDQNTCGPCLADDGKESDNPDDLPDTPNPECEGSDYCRCFKVAIAEGNM